MSEVIPFALNEIDTINGQAVKRPKTRKEYLQTCKRFLTDEDYRDILCGIMDEDIEAELEHPLQEIINRYFNFEY